MNRMNNTLDSMTHTGKRHMTKIERRQLKKANAVQKQEIQMPSAPAASNVESAPQGKEPITETIQKVPAQPNAPAPVAVPGRQSSRLEKQQHTKQKETVQQNKTQAGPASMPQDLQKQTGPLQTQIEDTQGKTELKPQTDQIDGPQKDELPKAKDYFRTCEVKTAEDFRKYRETVLRAFEKLTQANTHFSKTLKAKETREDHVMAQIKSAILSLNRALSPEQLLDMLFAASLSNCTPPAPKVNPQSPSGLQESLMAVVQCTIISLNMTLPPGQLMALMNTSLGRNNAPPLGQNGLESSPQTPPSGQQIATATALSKVKELQHKAALREQEQAKEYFMSCRIRHAEDFSKYREEVLRVFEKLYQTNDHLTEGIRAKEVREDLLMAQIKSAIVSLNSVLTKEQLLDVLIATSMSTKSPAPPNLKPQDSLVAAVRCAIISLNVVVPPGQLLALMDSSKCLSDALPLGQNGLESSPQTCPCGQEKATAAALSKVKEQQTALRSALREQEQAKDAALRRVEELEKREKDMNREIRNLQGSLSEALKYQEVSAKTTEQQQLRQQAEYLKVLSRVQELESALREQQGNENLVKEENQTLRSKVEELDASLQEELEKTNMIEAENQALCWQVEELESTLQEEQRNKEILIPEDKKALLSRVEELNSALQEQQRNTEALVKREREVVLSLEAALCREEDFRKDVESLNAQNTALREEIARLRAERNQPLSEVDRLRSALQEQSANTEAALSRVEDLEAEVERVTSQAQAQQGEVHTLQSEVDHLKCALSQKQSSLEEQEEATEAALHRLQLLEEDGHNTKGQISKLEIALREAQREAEHARSRVAEQEQEMNNQRAPAQAFNQTLQATKDTFETILQTCHTKYASVSAENEAMKKRLLDLSQETERLMTVQQQQQSMLQSSEEQQQRALQNIQMLSNSLKASEDNNQTLLKHNQELQESVQTQEQQMEENKRRRWYHFCCC